ncbi:MAG: hypothetical protein D6826_06855 [Alphaproteobacteria bacterium]|nr:MAG: hypothetical protein D6826_06855 [Alphaproteobacteria bacterium]
MRTSLWVSVGAAMLFVLWSPGQAAAGHRHVRAGHAAPPGTVIIIKTHPLVRAPQRFVYDDGRCRYKVRVGPRGVREKVRCRGGHAHRYRHHDRDGYPPWHRPYRPGTWLSTWQVPVVYGAPVAEHRDDRDKDGDITWESAPASAPRYCREYLGEGTIAGRVQPLYGRACRQPDGSWEIVP